MARAAAKKGLRTASKRRAPRAEPLRWAVVGLGHIAQVAVLPAFAHAKKHARLVALVSNDELKLAKLGKKHGAELRCPYEDFDELLASGQVDAVYVALPNVMHADFTIRAARAGVHVLCEKPMATTVRECEQMIAAAEESGVALMIAYRLHFERANLTAVELARSGRLGNPRAFSSEFTMQVVDPGNIRLDREMGGGPLWDIGIYQINAARYLFQAEPIEVTALFARGDDARFAEVDETCGAVLRFPGERLATFTCSFGAADTAAYRLIGTEGELRLENAYEYSEAITLRSVIRKRKSERVYAKRDQFAPELIHFSECVQQGRRPEPSGVEGLCDVRVITALFESARNRKAVALQPFDRKRRPTLEQEVRRAPVPRQEPVRARGPTES